MPGSWYLEAFARYPQCAVDDFIAIGNELPPLLCDNLPEVDVDEKMTSELLLKIKESKKRIKISSNEILQDYMNALAYVPKKKA